MSVHFYIIKHIDAFAPKNLLVKRAYFVKYGTLINGV